MQYLHAIHDISDEKICTNAFNNSDKVRAAIIWKNLTLNFKLPMSCSIFTVKSIAILKALKMIEEHSLRDSTIFFCFFAPLTVIKMYITLLISAYK